MRLRVLAGVALACSLLSLNSTCGAITYNGATPPTVEWTRHQNILGYDYSYGVAADGLGNVYISGYTNLAESGPSAFNDDTFLSKYRADGTLEWTEWPGTNAYEQSYSVSADHRGNVYISGWKESDLGSPDAFLSKYNDDGMLMWTRRLGTSSWEESQSVSVDGLGNVYISGWTRGSLGDANAGSVDAFMTKYGEDGTLMWTRQLGTNNADEGYGVTADSLGNVFICGRTLSNLGGTNAGGWDAFLSKYDTDGTLMWTEQLGDSGYDSAWGISADSYGNVYISGTIAVPQGGSLADRDNAFLSKFSADGSLMWTRQMDGRFINQGYSVSADSLGNVYLSGITLGKLGDWSGANYDAFVSKYDTDGTLMWIEQLGSQHSDYNRGVSVDGLGNVYLTGYTDDSPTGLDEIKNDVYLVKLHDPDAVPEPATVALSGLASLSLLARRRQC